MKIYEILRGNFIYNLNYLSVFNVTVFKPSPGRMNF